MAEQNISVGIDSAAAQLALRKLNKLFKEQGLSIQEVVKAGESLNKNQKGIAASFSGVLTTGQKFTASLKRVVNENGTLRKAYKLSTDAIETYGAAQERVTAQEQKAIKQKEALAKTISKQASTSISQSSARKFAKEDVPVFTQTIPSGANAKEIGNIERQLRSVEKLIESGKITRGSFHSAFEAIAKDSKATFTGMEADAAQAARRIITAFDAVDKRLEKDLNAVQNPLRRAREAKDFINKDVRANFGNIPKSAEPEDVARIQNAITSGSKLIESGKITRQQFNEVFKTLQTNSRATFTGIEGQAAKSLRSIQIAFDKAGSSGLNAAKAVILSWTGVVRIFAVQTLHLAIGRVIFSFGEMINKSAELSTKIAQIQTITQDASITTDQWARGLKGLSNAFGIDVIEVATAAYDALSNQAARGADVFSFLSKAAIFAKITNSNLTNSVNLLTAVTNSYGKEAITTKRASEVFFKVIDLGRVTADELAGSLGTVLQPASQLGIDIEEVGAAIATLSQQGINADTTLTLLRNVFVGLIKPTKEMQALINSWGVPTGEAAIKTFGWLGVIEKLSKELQTGGISRLGELESDIRKLTGTLGLTKNIDVFKSSLTEIGEVSKKSFAEAEKSIKESFGDRFKKQVQEAENVFNVDLGEKLLKSFVEISESFGGLGKVVKSISDPFINIAATIASFGSTLSRIITPIASLINNFGVLSPLIRLASGLISGYTIALGVNKVISLAVGEAYGKKTRLLRTYVELLTRGIKSTGGFNSILAKGIGNIIDWGVELTKANYKFGIVTTSTYLFKNGLSVLTGGIKAAISRLGQLALSTRGVVTSISLGLSLLASFDQASAEDRRVSVAAAEAEQIRTSTDAFEKFTEQVSETRAKFIKDNKAMEQQALVSISEISQKVAALTNGFLGAQQKTPGNLGIDLDALQKKADAAPESATGTLAKAAIDLIKDSQKVVKELQEGLDLSKFESQLSLIESKFVDIGKSSKTGLIDPFSNLTEKTDFVLKNIEELRQQAVKLYDEGNIEDARNSLVKAQEIAKFLEGSNPAKTIADLSESTKKNLQKLQIDALGPQKKRESLTETAKSLEAKAISLFNLGNLEDAKKLFDQVDSIFDQISDKEKSTAKDLAKLGVVTRPKTNTLQEDTLRNRLSVIESGASKVAKGETLSQQIAKQRVDSETKLQKAVAGTIESFIEMNEIQATILQNSTQINDVNAAATESVKEMAAAYKTADDRVADLLLKLKEARSIVGLGDNETSLVPSTRRLLGNFNTELAFGQAGEAKADALGKIDLFEKAQKAFDKTPSEEAFKKKAEATKLATEALEKYFKIILANQGLLQGVKDDTPLDERSLRGIGAGKVDSFHAVFEELKAETKKMEEAFNKRSNSLNVLRDQEDNIPIEKQNLEDKKQRLNELLKQLEQLSKPDFNPDDLSKKLSSTTDASKAFTGTTQENLTGLNFKLSETIAKVQALGEAFKVIPGGTASFNFQPNSTQSRQDSFLPTLQALNSGGNSRTPAASQVVDNSVQIGDIILNVDGSGNDAAVYERVVANIRRGIRSKTLRLES